MSIQDIEQEDCQSAEFGLIVKKFQQLDRDLKYPNCEGRADRKRIIKDFEQVFMDIVIDLVKYY